MSINFSESCDIVEALVKGVKTNGTAQSSVRAFITKSKDQNEPYWDIANFVAEHISRPFKIKATQQYVDTCSSEQGQKEANRKVNSILNDISRIVREELPPWTIVNTKRKKGEWVYEAIKFEPKGQSNKSIVTEVVKGIVEQSPCTKEHFDPNKHMLIETLGHWTAENFIDEAVFHLGKTDETLRALSSAVLKHIEKLHAKKLGTAA